jgi:hypothetical protein
MKGKSMNEQEFKEWLGCLSAAEEWLQAAFELMDGIEGYTSAGENAHVMALAAIRTVRTAETAYRSCPNCV